MAVYTDVFREGDRMAGVAHEVALCPRQNNRSRPPPPWRPQPVLTDEVRPAPFVILVGVNHRPAPIVRHDEQVEYGKGGEVAESAVATTLVGSLARLLCTERLWPTDVAEVRDDY